MPKIELEIPPQVRETEQELKEFLVAKLFEEGFVSSGTGSKMLGIDRRDFIMLLAKYDVDYINYSVEDLKKEMENL